MPNILVFLDTQQGALPDAGKRALSEGRRLASYLGATLYAAGGRDQGDAWFAEADLLGADKVALVSSLAEGPIEAAPAFAQLCEKLRPKLVLLPDSEDATALAGYLAASMEADFLPRAVVVWGGRRPSLLQRSVMRNKQKTFSLHSGQRTIVTTLSVPSERLEAGKEDADLVFFKASSAASFSEALRTASGSPLVTADQVVIAGSGALPHLAQVEALTTALGAAQGFTRSCLEVGLAKADRVVGWNHVHVAPRLCILCGVSGSEELFSAIAPGSTLLTLGKTPMSLAVQASQYCLLGDLRETLPALTLQVRKAGA